VCVHQVGENCLVVLDSHGSRVLSDVDLAVYLSPSRVDPRSLRSSQMHMPPGFLRRVCAGWCCVTSWSSFCVYFM